MKFNNYYSNLNSALQEIDNEIIDYFFSLLSKVIKAKGTILICGNGGSFANSLHIAGDYQKTFASHGVSFHSIGENFCSTSAIANDFCFEEAFSIELVPLIKQTVETLIIFLSGSGNSKNIVNAAKDISKKHANNTKLKMISVSAYGGGMISSLVEKPLKLKIKDMEIAEDIQLIIFHFLKQKLIERYPINKENYIKYDQRINNGSVL